MKLIHLKSNTIVKICLSCLEIIDDSRHEMRIEELDK
jgi:hypothetical protein